MDLDVDKKDGITMIQEEKIKFKINNNSSNNTRAKNLTTACRGTWGLGSYMYSSGSAAGASLGWSPVWVGIMNG